MLLDVTDLHVAYGDARVLRGISLELHEGEIVSIVGSNGAGKTTLVNAIAGLVPVGAGTIRIADTDVAGAPAHRVCAHGIAIVPEGRRIFPEMSVRDNLDLGSYRPALRDGAEQRRRRVHSLFPILEEREAQLAGSLSGGEQQQLAIARALMSDPRLLLLDEPSLGLAPVLVDEVFEVVREINEAGVSILLVEQDVNRALTLSTRGYLLSEGQLALEGDRDFLLSHEEVRRACLGV